MPSELNERFQRLSALHNALAQALADGEEGVSAETILERMDCERKALYRHAQDLRELGAPLEYDGKRHLWFYTREWNPPWGWLHTLGGAAGLRLSLDYLLDPDLERDLQDLVVPSRQTRSSKATLPRLTGIFDKSILPHLSKALREKRKIRFLYAKPDGTRSEKIVDPLSLFVWDGMPYLQARDPQSPKIVFKRYALSRITKPEVLEQGFKAPPRKDHPTCLGAFTGEVFLARIHAAPEVAFFVRERKWHPDQSLREKPDGSVEFTLPFGDVEEACRWILGRGPGFWPVAPGSLVKAWNDAIVRLANQIPAR